MFRIRTNVAIMTIAAVAGVISSANAGLVSHLTADDAFSFYVSTDDSVEGTFVGSGTSWSTTYNFSSALTPGVTNYIHVKAQDLHRVIAAWIGDFTVDSSFKFVNGTQNLLTNTTDWRESSTGWGSWDLTPFSYGSNGVSPWGTRSGIASGAQWLGYAHDNADFRYFSATILAVPLPSAALSGGAGLAAISGFALVRRRRLAAKA